MRRQLAFVSAVALVLMTTGCGKSDSGLKNADDAKAEIQAAQSEFPLPPGASYQPIDLDPAGAYQAGSGRQMIEYQAMCAWNKFWVRAMADGDSTAISTAERMADAIRTWDFYRSGSSAFRSHIDAMQDAARLGDPSQLKQEIELNC
jgi:hypothetical protein